MNGEWIHGRMKHMHCNGRPEAASFLHLIALEGFLIENHLVIYTKLDTQVVPFNLQGDPSLHFLFLSHVTDYCRSVSQ